MSLFNRKIRPFNSISYSGPGSSWVGGEGSGGKYDALKGSPSDIINNVADNVWTGATDFATTWFTAGLITDATELSDITSEYAGNLTGGAVGTSTQERMDAEQKSAQLQVNYEGYGRYRGELEKARQDNTAIGSRVRGDTRLKLAASGILKGSAEWNRRLAAVDTAYDTEVSKLDQQWKDYMGSSEYGLLTENYNLDWQKVFSGGGLTQEELSTIKPSFDEFYDMTRGTNAEKAAVQDLWDMRKENVVNQRSPT